MPDSLNVKIVNELLIDLTMWGGQVHLCPVQFIKHSATMKNNYDEKGVLLIVAFACLGALLITALVNGVALLIQN